MNSVQRQHIFSNHMRSYPWRRGNALVLVSAMLVLLVLIATAFLSRTQSQRGTAAAMQDASGNDRRVDSIKKQLASEIAMHLFVKSIDSNGSAKYIGGDSAGNRIPPGIYSVRYGVDSSKSGDQLSNLVDPAIDQSSNNALQLISDNFPDGYNFAPYSVIPWTNWPDFLAPTPTVSGTRFIVKGEANGNPLGNPGFGDTRWLRSTEPMRKDNDGVAKPDGDRFSHWPHLSWLPTPANGYRLVKDIADIESTLLQGGMDQLDNDAFGTPYEQWLPDVVPTPIIANAGTDPLADNTTWVKAFIDRRDTWFTRIGYQDAVLNAKAATTLPNFIKLDDPMSIGRILNPDAKGVSKSDEWFYGPSTTDSPSKLLGTPRNIVSRTFCDSDGDGFTDSFWFLAPVGKERNVRTIVGVSVIDNASMVDVNVATRADRRTTVGFTPSDIALVTSEPERSRSDVITSPVIGTTTDTLVGLFDNPFNRIDSNVSGQETHEPIFDHTIDAMASPSKFRVQFDPYRWAGFPTYYKPLQAGQKIGRTDPGQPTFLQALGLRSTQETWNDYFYGKPVDLGTKTPPTTEPFGGYMKDLYGPSGPSRPDQENPQYRLNNAQGSASSFRSALPNQPLVRPSERTRWFRSAATDQGTLFAESLTGLASNFEQSSLPNPTGDLTDPLLNLFGIQVPTRRFDASDELELRAHAGNNDSGSLSRLERSLNADDNVRDSSYLIPDTILRSTVLRGEAGGGQEQLTSAQLVKDLRHKITVVSGQRNEIMPPWLWIGRPYGIANNLPRISETFQNGMLWLDPHPNAPGPIDKDGDGRINVTESDNGWTDLRRIACSDDPFPDNEKPTAGSAIDGRDLNRAVRYFEELNAKLDLRKPLLVSPINSDGIPRRNVDGSLDQYMAMTVDEQRLAMQDFVREARGRLRMALRTSSMKIESSGGWAQSNSYDTDNFASYTDRFYEHYLFTMNTKVRIAAGGFSLGTLGSVGLIEANKFISFRSAWSTEALAASMAANIATWRSRPDLIYAQSPDKLAKTSNADSTLPLRAIHQPILPTSTPYSQSNLEPLAIRAADPSAITSSLQTKALGPDIKAADIVFPGIEKHPFFTEVFFGWVYPATTAEENDILTPAVFDMCMGKDPAPKIDPVQNYKYVALVNGRVGKDYVSVPDSTDPDTSLVIQSVDTKRNTLNKIRTPVIVVQVANPWNEPIRLGDFRINIFGTDYDFPDYELDNNGEVIFDSDTPNRPVPLMLAPGTETEPATATVYLIANELGNQTNAISSSTPPTEGDLSTVAMKDPLFRRRWLDYFDLYEYSDVPVVTDTATSKPMTETSPAANPLFWFTNKDAQPGAVFSNRLSRSKLLNAMQDTPGKPSNFYKPANVSAPKSLDLFKGSLTRDNMARGITLQRVLKNPAALDKSLLNLKDSKTPPNDIVLEVDRFDGHSELDHSTTVGTIAFDDRNFDTNLVTGGRFWTAAASITLPPTTGVLGGIGIAGQTTINIPNLLGAFDPDLNPLMKESDYSYDGPKASASLFPPPTTKQLVRSSNNKFRYLPIPQGETHCDVKASGATDLQPDSVYGPALFPGIVLGKVVDIETKADGDYFTTWTHVSRNWSRLYDAKFVAVPSTKFNPVLADLNMSALAKANLPVWNYTRELVTGSFASNPDPNPAQPINTSRSPLIPLERLAPRFMFSNRTEPEFTNRPDSYKPSRIELSNFVMNGNPSGSGAPANSGATICSGLTDPPNWTSKLAGTVPVPQIPSFTSLGDVFKLGLAADDPDRWNPSVGSTQWMIAGTYNMLLTPVWAPLPDFSGLTAPVPDKQEEIVLESKWPTLILRKPTSFNCQTVFTHNAPNEPFHDDPALPLVTGEKVIAYYGNPRLAPGLSPVNTQFVLPLWAAPPGSGSAISPDSSYRVYMADKGARLLDHDGLLLPINLATGGEMPGHPWRARGLWNTLDRIPQSGSLQMLQKDDDFEQIGELLDVFAWGPAYRIDSTSNVLALTTAAPTLSPTTAAVADPPSPPITVPPTIPSVGVRRVVIPIAQAKATFAEIMSNRVPGFPVGEGPFINRIQVDPLNVAFSGGGKASTPYQFGGTSALRTPYAPNVPWGMRIFDCFTVDGAGAALRFDWTLSFNAKDAIGLNIKNGGSSVLIDRNLTSLPITRNGILVNVGRPVGALVPVDVRSTINTAQTTSVTPQMLAQWEYDRSPSLSGNFSGLPTKGLLNINTASLEVLKTLPNMSQMVYEDTGRFDGDLISNTPIAQQIPWPGTFTEYNTPKSKLGDNPAVLLGEAMEIYRNQLDPSGWRPDLKNQMSPKPIASGQTAPSYPTFADRGELLGADIVSNKINVPISDNGLDVAYNTGMQSQRGFTTIGEITGIARQTNVDRTAISESGWQLPTAISSRRLWSVRLAGLDPHEWYASGNEWKRSTKYRWGVRDFDSADMDFDPLDARLSTDRQGVRQFDFVTGSTITERQALTYDNSYGDSEELNLLFKGISNLVTTRSDVFTVYFKVRTVKQNPIDGKWNGTDRESVLDDARYVMCVDRTNVNRPSDQPRIVYFSRVPE